MLSEYIQEGVNPEPKPLSFPPGVRQGKHPS